MIAFVLELPAFGLILLAGFVLIVTLLLNQFIFQPLAKGLHPLPFVGPNLADVVAGFGNAIVNAAQQEIDVQVQNLNDLIDFASGMVQGFFDAATVTSEWLGVQIGTALGLAHDVAGQIVDQGARLLALVMATASDLADLVARVEAIAAGIGERIVHVIVRQLSEVTSQIHAAVTAEIRSITDPIEGWIHEIRARLQAAIDAETQRAVQVETQLSTQVVDAKTALETDLERVRTNLRERIGEGDKTLQQEIGTITDLIGTVAAGTTLVGLITTVATTVETLERECVNPTFGYLSPQLPTLNAIADIATAAAFASFMVGIIQNPRAAADTINGTVDGLEGVFMPVFRSLSGLQV